MSTIRTAAPSSKIGPVSTDRNIASAASPKETSGDLRTDAYTYFTKVPVQGAQPDIIYNGDRLWVRLILTLETAGPVAIGTKSQIVPVLSGRGQLLQTGVPTALIVGKGTRVYIAATAINRVAVSIEPLPWMEQITAIITRLTDGFAAMFSRATGK